MGKTEQALDLSERLLRVAPLDVYRRGDRVNHFFFARQYERAFEEFELVREMDSDFITLEVLQLYSMQGRIEETYRAYPAFFDQCGAPCDWMWEAFARGWAEDGFERAARSWLAVATEIEGFSPRLIALTYASIGETEEAFAWLERGYRERDPGMVNLKASPSSDPLRSSAPTAGAENPFNVMRSLSSTIDRHLPPPYSNCKGSQCLTDVGREGGIPRAGTGLDTWP